MSRGGGGEGDLDVEWGSGGLPPKFFKNIGPFQLNFNLMHYLMVENGSIMPVFG